MNNTTLKLPVVEKCMIGGGHTPNGWIYVENIIKHTMEVEKHFWKLDFIIDDVLRAEVQNLTMTITGDTSSDSNSEST